MKNLLFKTNRNFYCNFYYHHLEIDKTRNNDDFFSQNELPPLTLEEEFNDLLKEKNYQSAWETATQLANEGRKDFLMQLWNQVQNTNADLAFQIIKQMAYFYQKKLKDVKDIKLVDAEFTKLCESVGVIDTVISEVVAELNACIKHNSY